MFDYGESGLDRRACCRRDLGFAGFRLSVPRSIAARDIAAFLGASYFRAVGGTMQYGLSARGLAVDCGLPRARGVSGLHRLLVRAARSRTSSTLVVYALLDSPSIAGAYRFGSRPASTLVMDVDAALYPRKAIERLGIAPLHQHVPVRRERSPHRRRLAAGDPRFRRPGDVDRRRRVDLAPAHQSAAACASTRSPTSSPRGFGLLQRDRNFDHYQDDGVFYDRRPSLWVEPQGVGARARSTGRDSDRDETFDNIVAFWNPGRRAQPGQELLFSYRLYWGCEDAGAAAARARASPRAPASAAVVGRKREHFSWRFVVDFAGGDLAIARAKTRRSSR